MSKPRERMTDQEVVNRADELTALLKDELVKRGHKDARCLKANYQAAWDIQLNGVKVPLCFEEESTIGTAYNLTYTGKIKVLVGSQYIKYRCQLKSRIFKESVKREHGVDIAKLADHIEHWVKTYNTAVARVKTAENAEAAHRKALEDFEARFPKACKLVGLTSEQSGLKFTRLLDKKDAEAILATLEGAG